MSSRLNALTKQAMERKPASSLWCVQHQDNGTGAEKRLDSAIYALPTSTPSFAANLEVGT